MVEIELDGRKVEVLEGSMVMHAADKAGTYIPHFCYHKKLSIAANCRMCLVDIEKAPKPMPACATPVTQGMIVRTQSEKALKAQQSVMEFLLINHPLDCPICDQGGECQLQDLAVGYGKSASRYEEEKRVVLSKNVGPLIGMEEMTRCIHCTRCVRFGQEVAGVMELGMLHRGEHAEITVVSGETIDSELSGNMIDLCPVGALTSKPFRYSARTWELSRRKSISPHDSTGSNLIVQVKGGRVMRVLPMENEAVNECWLADSDRFSYEGLNTDERLTTPMVKQGNRWQECDWTTALEYVANGLKQIVAEHGPQSIGALGTAHSTVEELHLLGKLVRGLGSDNVDHRLRHASLEPSTTGTGSVRWLGTSIASLSTLDRAFVIGSFLRKDHPLFAQRLRQATKRGAQITSLHALADDWLMPVAAHVTAAPSEWVAALAGVAAAVAAGKRVPAPMESETSEEARAIAASLLGGQRKAVLIGNAAAQHPEAETLLALAGFIAEHTGATCGYLGEAANSVGAQLVGALPLQGGLTAAQMLAEPLKAYVLLNAEPLLDAADPSQAAAALAGAQMVVAMTAFKTANFEHADVLLPIAPFTETSGTFVNAEGRVQSFHGVVKPRGDARPAWKVLRVLGTMLGLESFGFETSEEVKAQALGDEAGVAARLAGAPSTQPSPPSTREREPDGESSLSLSLSRLRERAGVRVDAGGAQTPREPVVLERIADVPIYSADAILRRSPPLQATADARPPRAGLPSALWQHLGLAEGAAVHVQQGTASVKLAAYHDASLAPNCVRVPAGHPATAVLGPMFGAIAVEKA
ncbi:MAG: NADH-quinone oxidoreductase subunit G [Methylibium sp.]|uniref:NADH-quinone oxidoreductase subunit NuoG n=1 Tax=Methylibium sp. TaxID=2067992 RepID=UPI00181D9F5E|nr:NADH-quinone oxidoreductase subunit NuoG [Methylibium sp.]MBA3598558.1 NADH-quinone oxidoreductase subunit G [Methylibium sp.]